MLRAVDQSPGVKSRDEIDRLLALGGGVLARRDHPELASQLSWLLHQQHLANPFPGIYVRSGSQDDWRVRVLAVSAWMPDAVFTGATAARLSYWPEFREDTVCVAVRNDLRPRSGYDFSRRHIPSELIFERHGFRMTTPALTALDISDLDQTEAIDQALRKRVTTLQSLRRALDVTPNRPGNVARRLVVLDSRDNPWSFAERLAHRLLHQAGIKGWKANVPLHHESSTYYLDVAFSRLRLAVEIDGRMHEQDLALFESDRWRQNALVLQGWRVLRFTWRMLVEQPQVFVRAVREAIAL